MINDPDSAQVNTYNVSIRGDVYNQFRVTTPLIQPGSKYSSITTGAKKATLSVYLENINHIMT